MTAVNTQFEIFNANLNQHLIRRRKRCAIGRGNNVDGGTVRVGDTVTVFIAMIVIHFFHRCVMAMIHVLHCWLALSTAGSSTSHGYDSHQ